MAWVRVNYPTQRRVLVDDDDRGETNIVMTVGDPRIITFSLAGDLDFEPESITQRVLDAPRDAPLEITFQPKDAQA